MSTQVHAYMLAAGYKLTGIGPQAEDEIKGDLNELPETDPEGWNSGDVYNFRYADATGKRRNALLVQALPVEARLLVNWLCLTNEADPVALELDVDEYTTDSSDLTSSYRKLDDFVARVANTLRPLGATGPQPTATGEPAAPSAGPGGVQQQPAQDQAWRSPLLAEPAGADARAQAPGGGVGTADLLPGGAVAPDIGEPFPVMPPGFGGVPPGGGGMYVGPNDPIFAGRRPRSGTGLEQPAPGMPGMRYDPINPPGMPGFNPEDFQRPRRAPHPDLAQPGPGNGTDWDSMFG